MSPRPGHPVREERYGARRSLCSAGSQRLTETRLAGDDLVPGRGRVSERVNESSERGHSASDSHRQSEGLRVRVSEATADVRRERYERRGGDQNFSPLPLQSKCLQIRANSRTSSPMMTVMMAEGRQSDERLDTLPVSQSLTASDGDDDNDDGEAPNDTRRGHAIRGVVQSGAGTWGDTHTHLHATPVTRDDAGRRERYERVCVVNL